MSHISECPLLYETYDEQERPVSGYSDPVTGYLVIPAKYYEPSNFHEGRAVVKNKFGNEGRFGLIDTSGNPVTDFKYYAIAPVSNHGLRAFQYINDKWGYLDNDSGEVVIEHNYACADPFSYNGRAAVQRCSNNLWGLIDTEGNTVTDFLFENIDISSDGRRIVLNPLTFLYGFLDDASIAARKGLGQEPQPKTRNFNKSGSSKRKGAQR